MGYLTIFINDDLTSVLTLFMVISYTLLELLCTVHAERVKLAAVLWPVLSIIVGRLILLCST